MVAYRGTSVGLLAAALCVGLTSLPTTAGAAEFYSWIDPSGTMVVTDDPGRIPPASQRSPVSVHRYRDRPIQLESPRVAAAPEPAKSEERGYPGSQEPKATRETVPAGPTADDLPSVLLEPPAQSVMAQYYWVPLVTPIYVGTASVSGFWCRRDVSSPVEAFTDYLAQSRPSVQAGQMVVGGMLWPYGWLRSAPSPWAHVSHSRSFARASGSSFTVSGRGAGR
jgi:hypothetical protein